jgi:hypothetical protein
MASVGLVQRRIPGRGIVHVDVLGIEVYWDPECTSVATEIDWGVLKPSDIAFKTVCLKNSGNAAITLSMVAEKWAPPEAGAHITVTWNVEGSILDVNATVAAIITLSVSAEITGVSDFSFDIVITGGG